MKALRIPAALMVLAALAVGCSEQKALTESTETFTKPAFNFTNGPDNPGIVIRFESGYGILFGDFDRELLSLHASDDGLLGCVPATTFEPADIQTIEGGTGVFGLVLLAQMGFVTVYDWTGTPPINCDLLTNATGRLLAEGSVQLERFDNDFLGGAAFGGEGANAFGFNSAGKLTNVATGKAIGYMLHRTHLIMPDGTFRINHVRKGPLLNPDPR